MSEDPAPRRPLPSALHRVAFGGGTEAPFSGAYWDEHARGMYRCAVCGAELFSSAAKFDSGTSWQSFTDPAAEGMVTLHDDRSRGTSRTEARCARCGAHLGHVFSDGPPERGGMRYCINSICLNFERGAPADAGAAPDAS